MTDPIVITVETGSRLHFGPFACGLSTPPFFGGVGLMIDSPGCRLHLREAETDAVCGPPESCARAEKLIRLYRENCPARWQPPRCRIEILDTIPTHTGLGSGTQLGLAVAHGLARLAKEEGSDPIVLARRVNRGRRSAIGVHGFQQGGFLIDAGKTSADAIGTLALRLPFPAEWRFLLVIPSDLSGICGDEEAAAFSRLPAMPAAVTDRLCRIALTGIVPAVQQADFGLFSEAMYDYGLAVGAYFSPVQGGSFRYPPFRQLVDDLRNQGILGIAQTSWGPAIAIAAENRGDAERIVSGLRQIPALGQCNLHIAGPRNRGAEIG